VRDMLGLTLEYYPSSLPVGYHFVRPPLPLLQAILIQVFRPSLTVDQIVARLLERLSSLVEASVLIAVEDLAALMSECRRNVQMIEEQESLQIEDDDALRFCLQAAKRSLAVLEKKLHQQYVNHGKLTLSEAAALMDVLSRTLYSRLQGEDIQAASLSAALAARPEFSDHQRRTTVRPLVDYLLKLYRREMNERVGEILS